MISYEQKQMAEFYRQCQENGYTDMSDDTQSLKAKVIAKDLNLKYNRISHLYKRAETAYNEVLAYNEREEKKRIEREKKQEELEKKLSVRGDHYFTFHSNNYDISVFKRPDGSFYKMTNGKRSEGMLPLSVKSGGIYNYEYHPSKTVFTGASVGGIATGGFHETKAYTTAKHEYTGTGEIVIPFDDGSDETITSIQLSSLIRERYKRDETTNEIAPYGTIVCQKSLSQSQLQLYANAGKSSSAGSAGYMSMTSRLVDEMRIPASRCYTIVKYIENVLRSELPPSDEEMYQYAIKVSTDAPFEELSKAVEYLKCIGNYKDASTRLGKLMPKYEEKLQIHKEQEIIADETKKKARVKKIGIAAVICVLIVAGISAGLIFYFNMPSGILKDLDEKQGFEMSGLTIYAPAHWEKSDKETGGVDFSDPSSLSYMAYKIDKISNNYKKPDLQKYIEKHHKTSDGEDRRELTIDGCQYAIAYSIEKVASDSYCYYAHYFLVCGNKVVEVSVTSISPFDEELFGKVPNAFDQMITATDFSGWRS